MENNYKSENGIGEGVFEMDEDEMDEDEMEKYEEEAMKDYYEQMEEDPYYEDNRYLELLDELEYMEKEDKEAHLKFKNQNESLKERGLFQDGNNEEMLLLRYLYNFETGEHWAEDSSIEEVSDLYDLEKNFVPNGRDNHGLPLVEMDENMEKPYLQFHTTDEKFYAVPMQWMEKALQSDIGDDIRVDMLRDKDVRLAVRKAVPSLTKGKEAITALKDFVQREVFAKDDLFTKEDKVNDARIKELAGDIASFDFLKFKGYVEKEICENPEKELWTFAAEAFNGFDVGNDSHEDEHYDIGKYRLPGKPDENLVNGINNVFHTKEDFSEMVDGLFGKNRVNTIHELKMIGSKDLSR